MKKEPIKAWGIVFPDNFIMVDSNFVTEARAWKVALGWPSEDEIERAKNNGHRAVLLTIDVNEQAAKPFVDHETEKMSNKDWIAADEVNALVQQLDVLLNGAEGVARQASLCDIVAQVARMQSRSAWPVECETLCRSAEALQHAVNELWKAEHPDELSKMDTAMEPDEARELQVEAWKALTTAIHYMRKRMNGPLYA